MRPEVKRWFKIIFCSLMVVFSVSIGFSTWIVPGEDKDVTSGSITPSESTKVPCAYIDNDDKTLYTIEDALDKARSDSSANTVYVLPKKNPTMTRNCTLSKEDTLVLSYDVSNPQTRSMDEATLSGEGFAESNSANLINTLIISNNALFTNYGTIEVGGQLSGGGGGQDASGQTKGAYTKITIDTGSQLVSYGNLYLYGYIDEVDEDRTSPSVFLKPGSYTKFPLIIRDFRGGSNMLGFMTKIGEKYNASPFNQIDTRNLAAYTKYEYGSLVESLINIYASGSQNKSLLTFIGSNGLFQIANQNSYITSHVKKAPVSTAEETSKKYSERINTYSTFGKVNVGNVSLSLSGLSFSLKNYFFPFCFRQQVRVNPVLDSNDKVVEEGNVHLPAYYKFLPGSSLIIAKNATVSCDGAVAVYGANQLASDGKTNLMKIKTDAKYYPDYYANKDAVVIVNGTIVCNNFGGVITTTTKDAVMSFSSTSVECGEYDTTVSTALVWEKYPKADLSLQYYEYNSSTGKVSTSLTKGNPQSYTSNGHDGSYGFSSLTSSQKVKIVYLAGNNCTYTATKEVSVNLYTYQKMLTLDKDLSSFKRTGYMLKDYTVYVNQNDEYQVGNGSGILVSDKIYSGLSSSWTLYVKVNLVESIDITFYYNSDNKKEKSETVQFEKDGDQWTYTLKTVSEIGLNLGTYLNWIIKDYKFNGYEIYPGVSSKSGTPAMILDAEGTAVNLKDEKLKSTI